MQRPSCQAATGQAGQFCVAPREDGFKENQAAFKNQEISYTYLDLASPAKLVNTELLSTRPSWAAAEFGKGLRGP